MEMTEHFPPVSSSAIYGRIVESNLILGGKRSVVSN
jgi:hypothetical protein